MSELIAPFLHYNFMQHALIACILSSIGCGIIGTYVVVRKIGFLVGGIAHSVLAGMGIAYFLGGHPLIGAVIAALFAAILISFIKLYFHQHEDTLVAAFWSIGMAIGVLFISSTPNNNVDLMSFLFGNILLVSKLDILLMLALDIIIAGTVFLFYKEFMATIFDEEFARLRDIRTEIYYSILMCMVALAVVLTMQVVGLILSIALFVLPAACAIQFFHSFFKIMLATIIICMLITIIGLVASFQPNLPAGSTITVVAGVFYAVSIIISNIQLYLKKRSAIH